MHAIASHPIPSPNLTHSSLSMPIRASPLLLTRLKQWPAGCLLECCRLTPRCPRCQFPITGVHLDPEFDALLQLARAAEPPTPFEGDLTPQPAPPSSELECSRSQLDEQPRRTVRWTYSASRDYVVRLRLPHGARAGITLKTCQWRFGVAVSATCVEKMAHRCGLCVGDVIVTMNGVPCRTHQQCIGIINRLSAPISMAYSEIVCLIIPKAADVKPLCSARDDENRDGDDYAGGRVADANGEGVEEQCTIL